MTDEYTWDSFQTDTGRLWYAGKSLLPGMADKYSGLSTKVWSTRGEGDAAFASCTSPTGNLPGIYREWDTLRGTFQNLLASSANNVGRAGAAILGIAEQFAATDGAAAGDIASKAETIDTYPAPTPKTTADPPPSDPGRPDGGYGE